MKHILTLVIVMLLNLNSFSQILEPVKWTTHVEKTSNNEAVLIATASIDDNWHLYSQTVPEGGPVATHFSFEGNSNYLKKGNTSEGEGHRIDDPVFNMEIKYFAKKALFKQRIKLKTQNSYTINATVEFMVCDNSRCLPPTEVDLEFEIK